MLSNFLKLSYFGDNVSSDCSICLFNRELKILPIFRAQKTRQVIENNINIMIPAKITACLVNTNSVTSNSVILLVSGFFLLSPDGSLDICQRNSFVMWKQGWPLWTFAFRGDSFAICSPVNFSISVVRSHL